jgi:hypothetical protein
LLTRAAGERAEAERRAVVIEAALDRVYGPGSGDNRCNLGATSVQFVSPPRSPGLQLKIARELEAWEICMRAGGQALARFQTRRGAVPSLAQIAGLIKVASLFGRFATGLNLPGARGSAVEALPALPGELSVDERLERVYGKQHDPDEIPP